MSRKNPEIESLPVLVVDDSATARTAMCHQLKKQGYKTLEASHGKEALEILSEHEVSLITLDVEMPEMNGFETCRILHLQSYTQDKGDHKDPPPVVFITGKDTLEKRIEGFDAGACDFFNKKLIASSEFVEAVDRYLRPDERLKGSSVLIVDDTKMVRFMLDKCIRSLGATTRECSDGEEAFELLARQEEVFDLVILDNYMPKMDGMELCQKIRRELGFKDLPVLFLSGTDQREEQLNFFKVGGSDYLVKPFIREELEARIEMHIKHSKESRELKKLKEQLLVPSEDTSARK